MDRFPLRYDQADDERRLVARLKEIAGPYEPLVVYLFGSRAGEDYIDTSDWDLFFVSPSFAGIPFLQRPVEIGCALAKADVGPIEVLCYTPEEFLEKSEEPTPIGTAIRTARLLYPTDVPSGSADIRRSCDRTGRSGSGQ